MKFMSQKEYALSPRKVRESHKSHQSEVDLSKFTLIDNYVQPLNSRSRQFRVNIKELINRDKP